MAIAKLTDIQKVARDCYRGNVEKFSKNAAEDVFFIALSFYFVYNYYINFILRGSYDKKIVSRH